MISRVADESTKKCARRPKSEAAFIKALNKYGTGSGYGKKILECEAALKALKPGENPYTALRKAR